MAKSKGKPAAMGGGKVAKGYTHPDQSLLIRPGVGTQAQFPKNEAATDLPPRRPNGAALRARAPCHIRVGLADRQTHHGIVIIIRRRTRALERAALFRLV